MDIPVCCRVCMSENELNPVFKEHDYEGKYELVFHLVTGEEISKKDEMPALICTECVNFINESIKFRKKCARSVQIFKESLSSGCKYENYGDSMRNTTKDFIYMDVNHYFDLDLIKREELTKESYDDVSSEDVTEMFEDELQYKCIKLENECSNNSDLEKDDTEMITEKIMEIFKSHSNNINQCENSCTDNEQNDDGVVVFQIINNSQDEKVLIKQEIQENSGDDGEACSNEDDTPMKNYEESTETLINILRSQINEKSKNSADYLNIVCKENKNEKELCGAVFKSNCRRRRRTVVCEYCGVKITQPHYLYHCKAEHGYKREKCKHCDYEANCKEAMKVHNRRHTGEKPYQCETCGATFRTPKTYMQHLVVHKTERDVKCDQCPKMFKSMQCLYSHRYIVHKVRVYVYSCKLCNKVYVDRHDVVQHIVKIHSLKKEDAQNYIEKLPK